VTIPGFDNMGDEPQGFLSVGFHRGIAPARYHSDPCASPSLSSTIANLILDRSPAHAKLAHPRLGVGYLDTEEETPAMARGTLLHRLLLGRGSEIEAVEPKTKNGEPSYSWATADAKEARARILAEGRIPVLRNKLREAELAAEVIRANLGEFGIDLTPTNSEIVAVWEDNTSEGRPVLCRGLLDNFDGQTIFDPKFTDDASPETIQKQIVRMGYAVQAAAYTRGVERIMPNMAGRIRFVFLFCEPTAPYAVTPVTLSGEFKEYGERRWMRALETWERCLREKEWPMYCKDIMTIEPPPWLLGSVQ
jgi:hypothetical protein